MTTTANGHVLTDLEEAAYSAIIRRMASLPDDPSSETLMHLAIAATFAVQTRAAEQTTPPWLIDALTQYARDMLTIQDANVQLIGQTMLFALNTAKRTVAQPAQSRETPGQAEIIEAAGRAIDIWSKNRLDFVLGTSERNELAAAVLSAAGPYIEAQTLISTADLASKALGDWGDTVRSWLLTLSRIKRRA